MTSFADPNGGGLFKRGDEPEKGGVNGTRGGGFPVIPGHGGTSNADAPLGTSIAVLTALGTAYLIGKKRSEE